MELSAGTSPGTDDILPAFVVHNSVTSSVTINLDQPLQEGTNVYLTLTVTNAAGDDRNICGLIP